MNISQISQTAILTLIIRVVMSEKDKAIFNDPMAILCLERLMSIVSEEDKRWIIREKRIFSGIQAHHAKAGVQKRVKVFDDAANRFIADNPQCTVINLACGFDTRFWRIAHENCRYVEIDLPEVIALKRECLKDQLSYELIGCSVLDAAWIDRVTANGNSRFLLLAEGLFMFLPKPDATQLFQRLAQRFVQSQLILDMVPEKFTKGLWKKLLGLETKYTWGVDVSWVLGIKHPRDIEAYGPGLKLLGDVRGSAGPIMTVSINAS